MDDYILKMSNITKQFPGVLALSNVSFNVKRGHIHALVGENGAGKSTLIKIISGVYPHGSYTGEIFFDGKIRKFNSIKEVETAGISCIHQELNLVPELSISENVYLSNKPTRFGIVNFEKMYADTEKMMRMVGLDPDPKTGFSPDTPIKNLGIAQKQLVEIAKALTLECKLLLLDEPTAALTEDEVDVLLELMRQFKKRGITCIYISHKLDEVLRIADDITVLRDGQTIDTRLREDMDRNTMVKLMVGRELTNVYPRVEHQRGNIGLEIRNYSVPHPDIPDRWLVRNANITAYRGEILGISGLVGAGRTELFSAVFGAFREKGQGEVYLDGEKVEISSPRDAISKGYFLLSEDRKRYGLNLIMSVLENTTMAALDRVSTAGVLNANLEEKFTNQYVREINVKTPNNTVQVQTLSGGNQQKVVIAKALMCQPKVIVLDEPTRGIDVGAKFEIYNIMNELASRGTTIVMISSDMEEILGMSDRIVTMSKGLVTGVFDHREATQESIMHASVGRAD
ncbi:MAG: sugar ABC transporter ATP-binding protein [Clostridia bacterium]|nr:sugar ABC transporter ATP-binding protein [Clostridia bacterium]